MSHRLAVPCVEPYAKSEQWYGSHATVVIVAFAAMVYPFGLILISILVGLWALWPDMNFVGLASVPLLIAVIVPPLFHPTAKTLWVGIDLMMNPVRPGEAVADLLDPERLFAAEPVDTEEGPSEQG